ncbi:hypothetical protein DYB32_005163 [Aphanomyces invadans]|uniref:Uncharacterized protein n=1 Tax=Aphanomyces invadans TaxID=157072 RepID=A0A3R6WLC7_9STRA|nr:hypothetical protein DYB32_005163 [Aphanomyces invadans]
MKDRVLYVLANATVLMGLPTLKKHLMEEFALQESKVFNTNVKKALAELSASPRDDFGKIGGSYHAGMSSVAYKAKEKADAELEDAQKYIDQGCIKCCFCGEWCPGDCELGEDSIARGSKYRCVSCNKIFWSWISDGYTVAHEVEYKKSFNY